MNASMPSSVQPAHAAQNPLIWFGFSFVGVARPAVTCMLSPPKKSQSHASLWALTDVVKREHDVQIVAGLRVVRIELNRTAEMFDRLVARAAVRERSAQMPVRLRRVGLET